MINVKWSAISFFGLGALVTASTAFAGCSVTTGVINDDGGNISDPAPDSGQDSGTVPGTDAATPACSNNTKQAPGLFADACQAALDGKCCSQLVSLFGKAPTDPTKPSDGNALIQCTERCNFKAAGTTVCTSDATCTTPDGSACLLENDGTKKCHEPETEMALYSACKVDCQTLTQADIVTDQQALETCIKSDPTATLECGELIR